MPRAILQACVVALTLLVGPVAFAAEPQWKPVTIPTASPDRSAAVTWYRCFIRVPADMTSTARDSLRSESVTLGVAGIPGPFVVHLNGREIAKRDAIADEPHTRLKVPKGILEKDKFNVLAIRLDAKAAGAGGIGKPPIFFGYWDEQALPTWEVQRGIDVDPASMKAVVDQPAVAAYTEKGFRESSTPLAANAEPIRGRRMSPQDSMATFKTPDDLKVELIACEPDVAQPTHISFDERGRMWVSQYRQYPYPAGVRQISRDKFYRARFDKVPPAPPHNARGNDRVTVFEDTNGDGTFDKAKVVLDGLNMTNAAVRGHGGIWVMNTPYLMFYPDADGDDVPDREPEVRLAGFGFEDAHSVSNGLAWGPDGWLYGVQGSGTTARVVRPGIDPPNSPGVFSEGCIVWRYHPETKVYEVFAEGGGNNFGVDFDPEGRLFVGDNGDQTRGYHFIQSGVYYKGFGGGKYGPPPNPFAFGWLTKMTASHPVDRFTSSVVLFGGTALPSRYVGAVIGTNGLKRTVVAAKRQLKGSTFFTTDIDTPIAAGGDVAFRPVFTTEGPDGAVYVADFYEEFIAHGQHYQSQIDPSTGRIYRLRGKDLPLNKDVNLSGKTTAELIATLGHVDRWHRQTAVRLLGERKDANAVGPLKQVLKQQQQSATHPALEGLWVLHQLGALDEATACEAMSHAAAPVRMWAIRLAGDAKKLSPAALDHVLKLVASEPDAEVRSQVISTARRLPAEQAVSLVSAVLRRDADARDSYIPLMCWWTIESHADSDRDRVMAMLDEGAAWKSATLRQTILPRLMRRFATVGKHADFLACSKLLRAAPTPEDRKQLMVGFEEAFKGRALPPLPEELASALADSGFASTALRVRLGQADAIAAALKQLSDGKGDAPERLTLVTLFGEVKTPDAVPILIGIAQKDASADLRKAALTALMLYPDDALGPQVAGLYPMLPEAVRPAAINLLASRASWAAALLDLIQSGKLTRADVPPDVVARLKNDADENVSQQAAALFPAPPPSGPEAKRIEVERVRRIVDAAAGDPYKGEAIYTARCAACHTLFYKGGQVGPNLTTYQREDLGSMLPSIIEPSQEVREGFETYVLRTRDGRTLSGYLVEKDPAVVVIRGTDGQDVRVAADKIAKMKPTGTSLMPDGLLDGLDDTQLRDFFAFLRIPQPISQ
jgi:putative membrane-bound dehydrogenase-like protein